MDFITFKNYLIKNNILLFDSHYRICYFKLNNLEHNIQKGGSNKNELLIYKIQTKYLNMFIMGLLGNNNYKINYIINSI